MDVTPLLRVLFVCRGSIRDGLGHVMRSRTVAREMSRRTSVRMLVVGDEYVDPLLAGRGLTYQVLTDESGVAPYAAAFQPHVVVFDSLRFSPSLIHDLRRRAMAVSLSPVFTGLADMDLVFHRTVHHGQDWVFEAGAEPQLRCSLNYAVVRENCERISEEDYRRNLRENPFAVAVSMGGADAGNHTLQILDAIKEISRPLLIWVLLGEGYVHSYEALVTRVKKVKRHEIILAKTSESMWRVLRTCSLAVLAAGTVTYEAAYAGLPSVNVFSNGEHLYLVRELVEKKVCISAGYPVYDALDVVAATIAHFEGARDELLQMHRNARNLIPGSGADRIGREIHDYYWRTFRDAHAARCAARGEAADVQSRAG